VYTTIGKKTKDLGQISKSVYGSSTINNRLRIYWHIKNLRRRFDIDVVYNHLRKGYTKP